MYEDEENYSIPKEDPRTPFLEHQKKNGHCEKYTVRFGEKEIILTQDSLSYPQFRSFAVFDAKTFLPISKRDYTEEKLSYEWKYTTEVADRNSDAPAGGTIVRNHALLLGGKKPNSDQCKPRDYTLKEFGMLNGEEYAMLDKAIDTLEVGPVANEIRRRFDAAAVKLGHGENVEVALGRS